MRVYWPVYNDITSTNPITQSCCGAEKALCSDYFGDICLTKCNVAFCEKYLKGKCQSGPITYLLHLQGYHRSRWNFSLRSLRKRVLNYLILCPRVWQLRLVVSSICRLSFREEGQRAPLVTNYLFTNTTEHLTLLWNPDHRRFQRGRSRLRTPLPPRA